jgi:hypothetical protein
MSKRGIENSPATQREGLPSKASPTGPPRAARHSGPRYYPRPEDKMSSCFVFLGTPGEIHNSRAHKFGGIEVYTLISGEFQFITDEVLLIGS